MTSKCGNKDNCICKITFMVLMVIFLYVLFDKVLAFVHYRFFCNL